MLGGIKLKGFTLVELLVVITIIGILAALVTVTVQPIQKRARDSKRRADITLMRSAADQFKADFKLYPNYTYYLGKITTGGNQSYFDLGGDIASCAVGDQNTLGHPLNFALAGPGTPPNSNNYSADNWTLKPGFASVNHFLICLKYIDRLLIDPNNTVQEDGYWYGVSYDYSESIYSAKAENSNDKEAKSSLISGGYDLTEGGKPKRYFEGNGQLNEQFDSIKLSTNPKFGKYLYQCSNIPSLDARASTDPLTSCDTDNQDSKLFY